LDHLITKLPEKGDKISQKGVSATNPLKKRKIKITVVGRTNVGKSSIINSMLKENRVIVSEVSGTTRDCVPIEWVYKGRRVLLTDTAGLQAKNKLYSKIDRLISAATIKTIKNSHVVIYVIDSMESFTPLDLVSDKI
jgi:GTP-binding protein